MVSGGTYVVHPDPAAGDITRAPPSSCRCDIGKASWSTTDPPNVVGLWAGRDEPTPARTDSYCTGAGSSLSSLVPHDGSEVGFRRTGNAGTIVGHCGS